MPRFKVGTMVQADGVEMMVHALHPDGGYWLYDPALRKFFRGKWHASRRRQDGKGFGVWSVDEGRT